MDKRALIITADYGVEEPELLQPIAALSEFGIDVTVASPSGESIQTVKGDKKPGTTAQADRRLDAVHDADFDLLVIPGGTVNADQLRTNDRAQQLVAAFAVHHKPIGAICHGPWILIDAGVVARKTLTSYPSLRIDLGNAGATWMDRQVFRCPARGWVLITSRTPGDLKAFNDALVDELVQMPVTS